MLLFGKLIHNQLYMKQSPKPMSIAEAYNNNTAHINPASSIWCLKTRKTLQYKVSNTNPKTHSTSIFIFSLLLSGDVELNPGPNDSRYICPFCDLDVEYGMKALQRDGCDMWYHKTCVSMCTQDYRNLENNSISYICCRCNHPNYTNGLLSYEIQTSNSFEHLDTNPIETINLDEEIRQFIPKDYSSPN